MKSFIRGLGALVATGGLILGGVACGSDSAAPGPVSGSWDEVVAAAEQEGSVHLYSTQHPDNLAKLKAAFEKEHPGISMEFTRGTDVEINPRVETQHRTGKGTADVHMSSDPAWVTAAVESGDYSMPVVGPNFDDADYRIGDAVLNDTFFLSSGAAFAMGWNTDALPKGLADPRAMLDDSLRGKIGVIDPAGFAAVVDEYRFFDDHWGSDFTDRLAALEPRVYPSALGAAQALTSGEVVATPMVQPLIKEMNAGAPVDWRLADEFWGTPWYSHVLSAAPHPNAAQVLANFIVSQDGQIALSQGYASALPDIPGAVARAQDIPLPDIAGLTSESVERFQQEWSSKFAN